MIILEGKKIAKNILAEIKSEIAKSESQPGLGVILAGNDEASEIYVALKEKAAKSVGIKFKKIKLSKKTSERKIIEEIKKLNDDKNINGIIVQLPMPDGLDKDKIIKAIDPKKDADGFSAKGGSAWGGHSDIIEPVFPSAIIKLIKSGGQELNNKKAIIVCNSEDFGKAMKFMLEKEKIIAEYIQVGNPISKLKEADIIITACGKPKLITGELIKDGAIVVDGGITKIDGRVIGDVDFESIKNRNIFLSPVPGGVGPVTIACLLRNVWKAYKKSR